MRKADMTAIMAAYVISLPRSRARLARMEQQLAAMALPYTLIPGIDGANEWVRLSADLDEPAFVRNVGRPVLPGEIGAYHAHLQVWQTFLKSDAQVALVMEDDVIFHPDFKEALEAALSIRDEWDFLKLNKIRAKQPICRGTIGHWHLNAYLGPATGLGAYLITRQLATKLLPAMLPATRPIDHELDRIFVHDFRHFGLEPFPSHVDDGNESTITGTAFTAVKKFPRYRRLPMYGLRFTNQMSKLLYLLRKGWLRANKSPCQPGSRPPFSTQ